MTTPVSSMVLVVIGGVIGSLGAVGLKAGSANLKLDLKVLATNWPLIGGVVAYLASSAFFIKAMANGQLSVLYPLVAMGQIWTLLWARIFFKEHITRFKLIAVACILVGVALISYGNAQLETETPQAATASQQ